MRPDPGQLDLPRIPASRESSLTRSAEARGDIWFGAVAKRTEWILKHRSGFRILLCFSFGFTLRYRSLPHSRNISDCAFMSRNSTR